MMLLKGLGLVSADTAVPAQFRVARIEQLALERKLKTFLAQKSDDDSFYLEDDSYTSHWKHMAVVLTKIISLVDPTILTAVFLDHNAIKALPTGPLHQLTNLRTLSLRDNELRALSGLELFPKLRCLDVTNNFLHSFPEGLRACRESLEELYIGYNQIRLIPSYLSGFTNLRCISTIHNPLSNAVQFFAYTSEQTQRMLKRVRPKGEFLKSNDFRVS